MITNKVSLDRLRGVPQTLLIPLRARYLETMRTDGIINDPKSVEIINSIEHNFGECELPWDCQIMISARTEIFDELTNCFLGANPDGVVVNLGCGLDTRAQRIDNGRMRWYDLDLAECIDIRRRFFAETDRIRLIAGDVLDLAWADAIVRGKKTLFIAEGLLNYFSERQVKSVFLAIMEHFPGSEIIFEAHSRLLARSWHRHPHIKRAYSMFKWGIGSGRIIERWAKGIKFLREFCYVDRHPRRWRWLRLMRSLGPLRRVMKVVHLRFDPVPA